VLRLPLQQYHSLQEVPPLHQCQLVYLQQLWVVLLADQW
jgi:hypothetical protein